MSCGFCVQTHSKTKIAILLGSVRTFFNCAGFSYSGKGGSKDGLSPALYHGKEEVHWHQA